MASNDYSFISEFAYRLSWAVAREIARTALTDPAQAQAMLQGRMNDQTIPDDVKAEFMRMIARAAAELRV